MPGVSSSSVPASNSRAGSHPSPEIALALADLITRPHFSQAARRAADAIAADAPDEAAIQALLGLAH